MKLSFQPSSLRHLILLGFFISLVPLCLLIWQSNTIHRDVSTSSVLLTKQSINTVRIAVEMDSLLVDIERGIRQFLILKSDTLVELASTNIEKYRALLEDICRDNPEELAEFCTSQQSDLNLLESTFQASDQGSLDTLLQVLKEHQSAMMQTLWHYLDVSTQQQQDYVDRQQKIINRWLIFIALATFFAVVLMSGRIAAPVKQLEEKIKAIGSRTKITPILQKSFTAPLNSERFLKSLFGFRLGWNSLKPYGSPF